MPAWYESHFTGLLSLLVHVDVRPHDPAVHIAAGEMPPWHAGEQQPGCSGAGWTRDEALLACVGEAIERVLARALPCDAAIEASFACWPLDEPAVDPGRWVLFHPEQYASEGFPFAPLTPETVCRWAACREALTGLPIWAPEELIFLTPGAGECQRHTFGFSTGLSCGRDVDLVLLRGAQEVIERDALVGGWWKSYAVEEWPLKDVRRSGEPSLWHRLERPNLRYRFYRIDSPFSSHVTMVSVAGEDDEGWVFSVGSACRETRAASWKKSLLEAIQGRHCVRRLLAQQQESENTVPTTFFQHALHYARQPELLATTIFEQAQPPRDDAYDHRHESLADLQSNLGPLRPILLRNLTPPILPDESPPWIVLRVLIPGLQPLHGDHRLPFLGGPLWNARPLADWAATPPHPFA